MDETRVNFASLETGQAGINAVLGKLRGSLDDLASGLQPMMTTWTGTAQQAYHVQKKKWDEAADALAGILHRIGSGVGDAHTNYRGAEKSATDTWS